MAKLTAKQYSVLRYLESYIKANKRPPTYAEIQHYFEWESANAPKSHLRALQRKGKIRIVPNIARGIELL